MAGVLATILNAIYGFIGNYGCAIILFTLLIKLALLLEYKSRRGMKQMEQLQPQMAAQPSGIAFDFSGRACAATVEAISA